LCLPFEPDHLNFIQIVISRMNTDSQHLRQNMVKILVIIYAGKNFA